VTIRSLFAQYGNIADVALKKIEFDQTHKVQNGYGFVHYALDVDGINSALTATKTLHKKNVDGVVYDCKISYIFEKYLLHYYPTILSTYEIPLSHHDENHRPLPRYGASGSIHSSCSSTSASVKTKASQLSRTYSGELTTPGSRGRIPESFPSSYGAAPGPFPATAGKAMGGTRDMYFHSTLDSLDRYNYPPAIGNEDPYYDPRDPDSHFELSAQRFPPSNSRIPVLATAGRPLARSLPPGYNPHARAGDPYRPGQHLNAVPHVRSSPHSPHSAHKSHRQHPATLGPPRYDEYDEPASDRLDYDLHYDPRYHRRADPRNDVRHDLRHDSRYDSRYAPFSAEAADPYDTRYDRYGPDIDDYPAADGGFGELEGLGVTRSVVRPPQRSGSLIDARDLRDPRQPRDPRQSRDIYSHQLSYSHNHSNHPRY
jgi:hypothetical protein